MFSIDTRCLSQYNADADEPVKPGCVNELHAKMQTFYHSCCTALLGAIQFYLLLLLLLLLLLARPPHPTHSPSLALFRSLRLIILSSSQLIGWSFYSHDMACGIVDFHLRRFVVFFKNIFTDFHVICFYSILLCGCPGGPH